jgi:hypothetical protein
MSFEICNKMPPNKMGMTPKEIICTKGTHSKERFELIHSLFNDCYFVPIYRDDDNFDVIIDKPSLKMATTLNSPLDSDGASKSKSSSSSNHISSPNRYANQKKLAGYVGPVSPSVVSCCFYNILSIDSV